MKNKKCAKKICGFVMLFCMLFVSCPVNLVIAVTETNATNTANKFDMTITSDKTDVKAGDMVEVSVNVGESSNIVDAQFIVNYDPSKVEAILEVDEEDNYVMFNNSLMSKKGWAIGEPSLNDTEGKVKIVASSMRGARGKLTNAGTLATIKFKVKEGTTGAINFSVTPEKFDIPGENGEGTIEVTPIVKDETKVIVPVALRGITLDKASLSVNINENSEQLTVSYNPENTTVDKKVSWEVTDTTIATVENGVVTGKKLGETTLTAKVGTCSVSIPVIVTAKLESISIKEQNLTVDRGTVTSLTLVADPKEAIIPEVVWTSSNPSVATVDNTGRVTSFTSGSAIITAKIKDDPSISTSCNIHVGVSLKAITLDKESITLQRDIAGKHRATLVATKSPVDTTDVNSFTWKSSNEKIVTVDQNGVITAVGNGTAQIIVSIGKIQKICTVKVEVPLKNLIIKEQNTEVLLRQSKSLTLELDPIDAMLDPTKAIWESSDRTIVNVDNTGKVTALKEGEVTITATLDGKTATTNVIAKRMPLNSIAMKDVKSTMKKGETQTLGLIQEPDNTTDVFYVTWSSSDESIATVDENGRVVALKAGTVTIKATCNIEGVMPTTTEITVEEINIEHIAIDKETFGVNDFKVGDKFTLGLTINPVEYTDNFELVWLTSDESIASVDEDGTITALKEGKVTFTAHLITEYGEEFEDTYEVYIQPEKIESPVVSPDTGDMNASILVAIMLGSVIAMFGIIKKRKAMMK